jgi:hypothetical protein
MPQTSHIEHHYTASEMVRDIVIGMAAGLPSAAVVTGVIVTAGMAEISVGAIE